MNQKNTQALLKNKLRKEFLAKRLSLAKYELEKNSKIIQNSVFALDMIKKSKKVGLYIDVNFEVQTKLLINKLIEDRKKVYLPKFHKKEWFYAEFSTWQDLESGPFNIPQPKSGNKIAINSLDAAILAGVAFSKNGHRLGYGKGVFDRMFFGSKVYKIGLAFSFQVTSELPHENHDLHIDVIVTEGEIIDTDLFDNNSIG